MFVKKLNKFDPCINHFMQNSFEYPKCIEICKINLEIRNFYLFFEYRIFNFEFRYIKIDNR